MAGKKTTDKEGSSWVGEIEKYSRKIWLAGLGIYSKIDQDGSKVFDSLVKEGEKAEKLAKGSVDSAKATAKSATSRISGVKDRALGKWDELEGAFDKRLNSAISRLGVPSRSEVKALHSKVDTLTKQIEKLTGASVTPISKKTGGEQACSQATGQDCTESGGETCSQASGENRSGKTCGQASSQTGCSEETGSEEASGQASS